jgi:uncharacterized protein YecT (DUF1311 family)
MKNLLLSLLIAMPSAAFAGKVADVQDQIAAITALQDICHASAMSNLDMKNCESNAYQSLDTLLNKEYNEIVINPENFEQAPQVLEEAFRESQRKWVAFRDANCSWKSNAMYGGTGAGLIYTGCLNKMTKDRILEMVEEYHFDQ